MPKTKSKKTAPKKAKAGSKEIAGVKVPKALRKFGPIKDMLNSDLGREILADALIAAAGAAAAALTKNRTGKKADSATKSIGQDVVHTAAGAVAGVVTDAARHFLPSALVGETDDNSAAERRPAPVRVARKPAGTARKPVAPKGDAKRDTTELTDATGKVPSEQ